MNALDRYLKTVKQFLPRAHRDEILRELAEQIGAQVQAREAELGRPLNEADLDAILQRHNSPIEVASHYRADAPRLAIGVELIGPALFPHYLKWLAIPIGITVLIFACALLAGKRPSPAEWLFPIAIQFTCVTLLFVAVQACHKKFGLLARRRKPALPAPELIRRYLYAVRFWLPKEQSDDILTELADDLQSKVEDREAQLGRTLEEGDVVAILKERGEPLSVACGYLPPRYLIGPALFPIYLFIVKLVVLWILVPIYILVVGPIIVKMASNPVPAAMQALWSLLMAAMFAFGVITIVFATIERRPPRSLSEWDPRRLHPAPARPARDLEPMTWYRAVANIFVSTMFALGWVYVAQPERAAQFEGVRIWLAPFSHSLFWPILAVLLSGAVAGLLGLLRPNSARLHAAVRLAANGLALGIVGVLLAAPMYVEIAAPELPRAGVEEAAHWTNLGLWISLLVVGVTIVVETIKDARRLFRHSDHSPAHSSQ